MGQILLDLLIIVWLVILTNKKPLKGKPGPPGPQGPKGDKGDTIYVEKSNE